MRIILFFIVALIFIGIDRLALGLLPILKISYGRYRIPFYLFTFLRITFLVFWLTLTSKWLLGRLGIVHQNALWIYAGVNFVLLGLIIYGFYIEPMRLTVTRIDLQVAGIKEPVRIVQLSDIHVEFTTHRELALPGLVESLEPDIIVMTGDFPNESYSNHPKTRQDLQDLISRLHAPLGVYAVNGNVESVSNLSYLLEGLDVKILDNEITRFPSLGEDFVIIGLSYSNPIQDEIALQNIYQELDADDYVILLYHKPDLAYRASDLGIDLYLAGHTHGGQVRIPFYGAISTNSKYGKTFEMGAYTVGNMKLFVSRGLGFTGGSAPRLRFLAPPEVVVIDLIPLLAE